VAGLNLWIKIQVLVREREHVAAWNLWIRFIRNNINQVVHTLA
jgi:hypothetical protein